MKFYLDTANLASIKKYNAMGLVDGVTTNPSLIVKEGADFEETIKAICKEVYPNPVMITALGVSIRLRGNGSRYQVDVIDVRGRRVRHLDGVANGVAFWNGRDDSGTLVRPGIYFIRAETGGRTGTARVALIR